MHSLRGQCEGSKAPNQRGSLPKVQKAASGIRGGKPKVPGDPGRICPTSGKTKADGTLLKLSGGSRRT